MLVAAPCRSASRIHPLPGCGYSRSAATSPSPRACTSPCACGAAARARRRSRRPGCSCCSSASSSRSSRSARWIPFYNYPLAFRDSRAPLPFAAVPWLQPRFEGHDGLLQCSKIIAALPLNLPLSIPLMEASLAFAALWTARLLGVLAARSPDAHGPRRPLVDSALDPVVATSFTPSSVQLGHGMGLWRWVVVDELGPDAFGIPAINYGVWFAGTVILVCLIELLRKVGLWDQTIHARCLDLPSARTTPGAAVVLWGALFVASLLVIALSPVLLASHDLRAAGHLLRYHRRRHDLLRADGARRPAACGDSLGAARPPAVLPPLPGLVPDRERGSSGPGCCSW